jgi:branched-chain amino acid transport system substrate-binding protein
VAAEKAVEAGITAIIGPAWSSHAMAVAKVAQAHKIPMITNVATHPDVTKAGDFIFRICFIDPFQGSALAQFVRHDLEAKTAAILKNVSSDYSMGLAKAFRKNFEQMNGKVLLELDYIQKQRDFKKPLGQIKQVLPDILFIPGHDESGFIAQKAQKAGITSTLVGGDGWAGTSFFEKGGRDLNQGYFSTHWSRDTDRKAVQDFLHRFRNNGHIAAQTVLAYDAAFLLADAINRAGTLDRNDIREAIAQTKDFRGVTGNITLGEHGDPVKSVVIMEIANGDRRYLKTIEPSLSE